LFGLGMPEVILILIIALVVFGPSKLPEMGASLGKAIREFQKATQESIQESEKKPVEAKLPVEEKAANAGFAASKEKPQN